MKKILIASSAVAAVVALGAAAYKLYDTLAADPVEAETPAEAAEAEAEVSAAAEPAATPEEATA